LSAAHHIFAFVPMPRPAALGCNPRRHPSPLEFSPMKLFLSAAALALTLISGSAFAASHAAAAPAGDNKQQGKMATCNKDAGDKKGDERKAFMKTCLSAKKASQQDKMKTCNASASGKKGDERKAYMKDCLSK
jgi:psiF repeat